MTDIASTVAPKSDQLNADDLVVGPRTIKITKVVGYEGDQPIGIFFEGDDGKPYKPCKSMRRLMLYIWGDDGNAYAGRSLTLFNDPEVTFGGIQVGGIRISHMSDIEKPTTLALTVTRARRVPYTVQPLLAPAFTDEEAFEKAKVAASAGREAFRSWWASDEGKAMRGAIKPRLDELESIILETEESEEKPNQ